MIWRPYTFTKAAFPSSSPALFSLFRGLISCFHWQKLWMLPIEPLFSILVFRHPSVEVLGTLSRDLNCNPLIGQQNFPFVCDRRLNGQTHHANICDVRPVSYATYIDDVSIYHSVTTPTTFKSTVCSKNTKQTEDLGFDGYYTESVWWKRG